MTKTFIPNRAYAGAYGLPACIAKIEFVNHRAAIKNEVEAIAKMLGIAKPKILKASESAYAIKSQDGKIEYGLLIKTQ